MSMHLEIDHLFQQPSLLALALLALEVEEQHEFESVDALREAVQDLKEQLFVSVES